VLRAHRKPPKSEPGQLFANRALVHVNTKSFLDLALEIEAPPAHHPVRYGVRAIENPLRRVFLLAGLKRHDGPDTPRFNKPGRPSAL